MIAYRGDKDSARELRVLVIGMAVFFGFLFIEEDHVGIGIGVLGSMLEWLQCDHETNVACRERGLAMLVILQSLLLDLLESNNTKQQRIPARMEKNQNCLTKVIHAYIYIKRRPE